MQILFLGFLQLQGPFLDDYFKILFKSLKFFFGTKFGERYSQVARESFQKGNGFKVELSLFPVVQLDEPKAFRTKVQRDQGDRLVPLAITAIACTGLPVSAEVEASSSVVQLLQKLPCAVKNG